MGGSLGGGLEWEEMLRTHSTNLLDATDIDRTCLLDDSEPLGGGLVTWSGATSGIKKESRNQCGAALVIVYRYGKAKYDVS